MNKPSRLQGVATFAAAVFVGGAASLALAGVASVTQSTPTLRSAPAPHVEVVRLEPVIVTMSRAQFDAIRAGAAADTAVARAGAARHVNRG